MTILAGDFGWNFNKSRSNDTSKVNKKPVTQQAKTDIEKAKPLTPTLTRQRRSSKKQSTPKKTRSGRTIKIPQVDGNADSSGSEIDDKNHKIPQFDGQNDGQYSTDSGNAGQPQSNQSSYYIGDNQSFSGVIPILMPPGPGQTIEQAIAQPVIRMQPVMQQTNVIHVGQGGTVIFPTGQQVNQVHQQQDHNQQRFTPAPGNTYTFVQSQGSHVQRFQVPPQHSTNPRHMSSASKAEYRNDHYFPLNLDNKMTSPPGTTNARNPGAESPALSVTPAPSAPHTPSPLDPLRTPALSPAHTPVQYYQGYNQGRLGMVDQRMLEQQRLQEHRMKQQRIHQQRLMEEHAMKQLEHQHYKEQQRIHNNQNAIHQNMHGSPVTSPQQQRHQQTPLPIQSQYSPHSQRTICQGQPPGPPQHYTSPSSIVQNPAAPQVSHLTAPSSVKNSIKVEPNENANQNIVQRQTNDRDNQKRRDQERKRILDEQRKIQLEENRRKAENLKRQTMPKTSKQAQKNVNKQTNKLKTTPIPIQNVPQSQNQQQQLHTAQVSNQKVPVNKTTHQNQHVSHNIQQSQQGRSGSLQPGQMYTNANQLHGRQSAVPNQNGPVMMSYPQQIQHEQRQRQQMLQHHQVQHQMQHHSQMRQAHVVHRQQQVPMQVHQQRQILIQQHQTNHQQYVHPSSQIHGHNPNTCMVPTNVRMTNATHVNSQVIQTASNHQEQQSHQRQLNSQSQTYHPNQRIQNNSSQLQANVARRQNQMAAKEKQKSNLGQNMKQELSSSQGKIYNVQRSPKIDEAKIQEIKKELQSPPKNVTQTNQFRSPINHATQSQNTFMNNPVQNGTGSIQFTGHGYNGPSSQIQPKNQVEHRVPNSQQISSQSQQPRPSIIRRTDSPSLIGGNIRENNQYRPTAATPIVKQEPGIVRQQPRQNMNQGPAFGDSQYRIAPGAGPLPGLKHERTDDRIPRLGTFREEQHKLQQQQRLREQQQQISNHQRFYQQAGGFNNGHRLVRPSITPIPRSHNMVNYQQQHQPQSQFNQVSPSRKPWDLDLQPRRQSGIEIASRGSGSRQEGIEVIGHVNRQQQFVQQNSMVTNPGLAPGFQIYNGQLIEVRQASNYQIMTQNNSKTQRPQQSQFVLDSKEHQNHRQPNQASKRPGWDISAFDLKKNDILKEARKEFTEKLIKKKPLKATKLIWDPIVLDETTLLERIDSETGKISNIDTGFDDSYQESPLLAQHKMKTSPIKSATAVRPKTPPAVDDLDQDEYELFFTIVSDDGYRQSGKDLEAIWNEILDSLDTSGNHPGCAPRSTRPDVYKAFGFSHDIVRYLLEQLPSADTVTGVYNAKFFHRTHMAQLVAKNPKGSMRAQGYSGKRNPTDMFSFLNSEHRDGLKPDLTVRPMNEADLPLTMRFRRMVETSRTSLQVLPSTIHGRGLFARRAYEAGELVIEYAGEVIRGELCDKREKYYDSRGIGTYMFRVDDKFVVDATMDGGRARFINHSCGPNCMSKIITVDGRKHICIIAGRNIDFGEELTYDYKFDRELGEERILCGCQAPNCRGYMN